MLSTPPITALGLDEFHYTLPPELIAQHPPAVRGASRLLHLQPDAPGDDPLQDRQFADLPQLLGAGDLLLLNDTRVLKARLYGRKDSGGRVELLVERLLDEGRVLAQLRASKTPPVGSGIQLDGGARLTMLGREGEFFLLDFGRDTDVAALLEQQGQLPLPPYIRHAADASDDERYQTVFARNPGAVAAPTASLHFDHALLQRLREAGVQLAHITLHVGAGTFQPVREDDLSQHRMHAERYHIPEESVLAIQRTRAAGGRIVAAGTTVLRALESAAAVQRDTGMRLPSGDGETRLFITPGYRFRVVDRLITNFHLPKSTLLMLVSAFAGMSAIRRAYAHAIANQYRFFSYGDAMLIERAQMQPETLTAR
jgi:S-adenosylmethionine:tRNA ribosyltransferase-isomerase